MEKEETTEEVIERTETEKKLKELQKMVNEKATSDLEKPKRPRKSQKVEKREIDLHINNLIDDVKGLENKDILEIQMEKFHSEMKSAIADNLKRIVFIHGIGNGTLKNEVRKALTNQYSKYEYHDASYKEYGFGATLVVITN
jgi:dsDNA-specific endonuclease/ATPase MutS2